MSILKVARLGHPVLREKCRDLSPAQMSEHLTAYTRDHLTTDPDWRMHVEPAQETYVRPVKPALTLLLVTGFVVLAVVVGNVTVLVLVRSIRKERDVAVRRALGAGEGRVMAGWLAEAVVLTVMRRPPECAALYRRITEQGQDELKRSRSLERTMREITVIDVRNKEGPQHVEADREQHGKPGPADPEHTEAHHVQQHKAADTCPVDAIGGTLFLLFAGSVIEPAYSG